MRKFIFVKTLQVVEYFIDHLPEFLREDSRMNKMTTRRQGHKDSDFSVNRFSVDVQTDKIPVFQNGFPYNHSHCRIMST